MTSAAPGLALVLAYSPDTGVITWRVARRGIVKGSTAGGKLSSGGYLRVCVDGRLYYAHRIAWAITHGSWPSGVIDHINGIKTDNRLSNLRDVSQATNMHNQRNAQRTIGRTSKYLGVAWAKRNNKWRAAIKVFGYTKCVGYFDDELAARAAYLEAKQQLHYGATQ